MRNLVQIALMRILKLNPNGQLDISFFLQVDMNIEQFRQVTTMIFLFHTELFENFV